MLDVKRFETALSEQCVTYQLESVAPLTTLDMAYRFDELNQRLELRGKRLGSLRHWHIWLTPSYWRAGAETGVHNGGYNRVLKLAIEPLPVGVKDRGHYDGLKL